MTDTGLLRMRIAEHLIAKSYRFLDPKQAGYIAGRFKTTADEVEIAAVLADRIRRARQLEKCAAGRIKFSVIGHVDPEAPIILKSRAERTPRRRQKPRITAAGAMT